MNESRVFARRAVALVLVLTAARLLYLGPLDVLPDEADNFVWSQHLDLGYYDQPPLLMWLLALARGLLGSNVLAVRLVPALLGAWTGWFVFQLGRDLVGPRLAFRWLACLLATPLFFGGAMFATPDAPMILFLAGATYYLRSALVLGSTRAWTAAGLFAGLALLSKFVAVLTVGSFALILLLPEHRRWLARREPWLALILAALVFLPVVVWNWSHDWVAFRFQWAHGLGTDRFPRWPFLPEYFGLQAMVVGPFAFAGFLVALGLAARGWRSLAEDRRFLACLAGVPFVFFLASSLLKRVEANWPCYAYLPGLLLLVLVYEERGRHLRGRRLLWRVGWAATVLGIFAVLVHVYRPFLPLSPDRAAEFGGWRQLGAEATRLARAHPGLQPAANRYQLASELTFYTDAPVLCLNLRDRLNQYDLWQDRASLPGRQLLFFHDRPAEESRIFDDFSEYREVATLSLSGPGRSVVRRVYVYAATLRQ